jgi:hypothetical protein
MELQEQHEAETFRVLLEAHIKAALWSLQMSVRVVFDAERVWSESRCDCAHCNRPLSTRTAERSTDMAVSASMHDHIDKLMGLMPLPEADVAWCKVVGDGQWVMDLYSWNRAQVQLRLHQPERSASECEPRNVPFDRRVMRTVAVQTVPTAQPPQPAHATPTRTATGADDADDDATRTA